MRRPELDSKRAFLHVIYDHRYLAVSGYAWQLVGPSSTEKAQTIANQLLPEIGVAIQDSLLLHARSLIDFYTKTSASSTDILLFDFDKLEIDKTLQKQLTGQYKNAIEVHLLHLTAWRDIEYRKLHDKTREGTTRDRPIWDVENTELVNIIFSALKRASDKPSVWKQPFKDLYDACSRRLKDPAFTWPNHLLEKLDVDSYLTKLGL